MVTKQQFNELSEDQIINALPHGSGIDARWEVIRLANGKITCLCAYHGMNEHGYYDGWQTFKITLFINDKHELDFKLNFTRFRQRKAWAYGLREYLEDTIAYSLEALTKCKHPNANEGKVYDCDKLDCPVHGERNQTI